MMQSILYRLHPAAGRYIVDAKSILGVFSLPTFDNVEIGAEEEDVKELREKLENLNLIRE